MNFHDYLTKVNAHDVSPVTKALMMKAFEAGQQAASAVESVWMYKGSDGEWKSFMNEQHRLNTITDGSWDVREFFAAPAMQREPAGYVRPHHLEALRSGKACGITLEDKPDAHNRVTIPLYTAPQPVEQQPAPDEFYIEFETLRKALCMMGIAAPESDSELGVNIQSYAKRIIKSVAKKYPQPAARPWSYCPECGSEHVRHYEGEHKQCANCHQEWFSDTDYTDVVRKHLAGKFRDKQPDDRADAVRLDKQCREEVAAALGFVRGGNYAWSYLLQQIKDITSAAEAQQPTTDVAGVWEDAVLGTPRKGGE